MKKFKRLLAALLAGVMVAGMSTTAFAEGEGTYEPTNTYVLNYKAGQLTNQWQYFSPYKSQFNPAKYNGYDMISFSLKKEGTEELFATYCVDLFTGLDETGTFRRLNLEDSTYFDATVARKLRSVFLNGYPYVSDLTVLAEKAGVESLTVGEAVSATQMAIWEIAHGDRVEITDYYQAAYRSICICRFFPFPYQQYSLHLQRETRNKARREEQNPIRKRRSSSSLQYCRLH